MRLQTGLLPLFLLALVLASYVGASAKKSVKDNNKQVPILSDSFTERGDAVTLPSPSVPKSMPKPKPASLLVDTTNIVSAVQLKDQGILVQSVPEESQASGRDEHIKKFEELINKNQHKEIVELGEKMSVEELLKCLCQVVTSLDHFKGLYEYLKQRKMVPGFLAHGEMVVVRKVIVESSLLETDSAYGYCDSISDAIVLSLERDRHERVASLFKAAQERPDWKPMFGWFVGGFFIRYPPSKNGMPLKRFLTLHGGEFGKKHPAIFETICEELVWKVRRQLDNPVSQKLLIDLVGQPSLPTPVAFARGFLYAAGDACRADFIKYGYKEAIEEGLKEKYPCGGGYLWNVMVGKYPTQFSGECPSTDEARSVALKDFKPTKQDLEEEWAKENAPIFLAQLETLVTELPIAKVLLPIIAEYAITWVVV